ncbi:type VI secretion protein IcmF/TssM N-terminal domain-containing protein, partial [Pseudomonas aeruginosa]
LYELPWYMVIGNPAAGKSSAIYNSGLKFPFEETHQKMVSAGLSGTRNCDWFFSTEGILLDTAGRYSVYSEDHSEWLGFLNILKKNRSKAPVNGLILIVSIAELVSQSPEHSLKLAKNLRARIQDLTERLEVVVPVYLVFSKMDLIAGFTEFFEFYEAQEYNQAWG